MLLCLWPSLAFAAKTDTLVLKNGDRITGEVKGLMRGKLDYSTDDAGRLAIEWVKVIRIESPHWFEFELGSGAKFLGRPAEGDRDGMLVVAGVGSDTMAIADVVRISPLEAGFAQRTQAFLDMGLTFAKANQATTFNMDGEVAYRGERMGSRVAFNSYAQGQENVPTTTRNGASVQATYYLPHRWTTLGFLQTERNDELNLELRVTAAAMMGRVFAQSNAMALGAAAGIAVARERFSSASEDATNGGQSQTELEAVLAGQWDAFRFDSPKLDFTTSLYLYPSLTTWGRVRGESTTRLKYELFKDFNVGLSITDTFDSDPPEAGATKNDYITALTIGWSYRR
jgi:hypothetical protein